MADTWIVYYSDQFGRDIVMSEHDTKLKAIRAHNRMAGTFARTNNYPREYGWYRKCNFAGPTFEEHIRAGGTLD